MVFFCCGCAARFFLLRVFLLWVLRAAGSECALPGLGTAESKGAWAGQPGDAFCFCCGCAASSLTHMLPAASEHPLQKDIQGPGRFCFGCGCASSLTHSLPAARSTHSKKAPTTKTNKHTGKVEGIIGF